MSLLSSNPDNAVTVTRIETYIPLYRKYRPQTFSDVVGQEAIVQTLGNAIQLNRVAHAYLFCGPRGTGKTSTARIFAKSLNCEQGPTVTPCMQCASCTGITNGNALDVIEFDAASNNGVDDARELIENCQYSSMNGRFKVYIVDEVHMLTSQAFNALLKTLEEPPENVIFIFATTEAHKVLPTIVSRCQRFDFNRITTANITERLKTIASAEDITIQQDALQLIARHARGGMRDAVGLLDQVSVLGRGQANRVLQRQDVALFIGTLGEELLLRLGQSIATRDANAILSDLNELASRGTEPSQLLKELSQHFRNLLVIRAAGANANPDALELPTDYIAALQEQTQLFPEAEELPQLLARLVTVERNVRNSNQPQLWLEVGLLELAYRHEIALVKDLSERVARLEEQLSGGVPSRAYAAPAAQSPTPRRQAAPPPPPLPQTQAIPSQPMSQQPVQQSTPTPPLAASTSEQMPQSIPAANQPLQAPMASLTPTAQRYPQLLNLPTPEATANTNAPVTTSYGAPVPNQDYERFCAAIPSPTLRSLMQQQAFPLGRTPDVLTIGVVSEANLAVAKKPDRFIHLQKAVERIFGNLRVDLVHEKNRPQSYNVGLSPAAPPSMPAPPPAAQATPPAFTSPPSSKSTQSPGATHQASQPAPASSTPVMRSPALPLPPLDGSTTAPIPVPANRPPAMTAMAAPTPINFGAPPPPPPTTDAESDVLNVPPTLDGQIAMAELAPSSPLWADDGPPPMEHGDPPPMDDENAPPDDDDTGSATPSTPAKPAETFVMSEEAQNDPALREAQQHAIQLLQGKVLD